MINEDKITLLDRVAVGVLSALSVLTTLGAIILILVYVTQGDYFFVSVKMLVGIAVFFFILGFVTLDNYFISILSPVWKFIEKLIKWY